jgi:hypothetical protein
VWWVAILCPFHAQFRVVVDLSAATNGNGNRILTMSRRTTPAPLNIFSVDSRRIIDRWASSADIAEQQTEMPARA